MNKLTTSLSFKLAIPSILIGTIFLLSVSLLFSYHAERTLERESNIIAQHIQDTLLIANETNANTANLRRIVKALTARNDMTRLLPVEQASGIISADSQEENIGQNVHNSLDNAQLET
ncbi:MULTISPECIES: hypothetical protein [unclassified Oleiphilus]|jgi:hypothetical protein|uniref:hypothetical protein n=3 Tax=Oleiphilus TaxID=141450 RepID=UPI0007C3AE1E|nr:MULTISPECIES: hypothetical protein [unclassified Oleiphilus]KZY46873.1 hypothetical protein A3732_07210 [Oleiphilus sp. HI0050]KZY75789.1 hypothetical protein A3741_11590 [Oleiphilus sp. HI0069]KZY75979.1 hypothetical protein A3740_13995 [Oleiphilus sp. HI0068]KZY88652.1 hypothetical protein A3743_11085 [Oleiphilus sp. HI0072]KZZ20799.1 hypothetical protein A3749_03035 [Oleiphilus sp. HI0078]KZZ28049.1 hypothetical protein A3752_00365 [Oleiphilus sp. HI0081]